MKKKIIITIIILTVIALITTVAIAFFYPPLKAQKKAVQYLSNKYGYLENDLHVEQYQAGSVHPAFLNGAVVRPETFLVNTADGKAITVIRQDSHFADNKQILEISYLAADYFTDKIGANVDFVEFQDNNGNKWSGVLISLIKANNANWNKENIKLLLDEYLEDNFNILNLYIHETDMDLEYLEEKSRTYAAVLENGNYNLIYHDVELEISISMIGNRKRELFEFEHYIVANNPLSAISTKTEHFNRFSVNKKN